MHRERPSSCTLSKRAIIKEAKLKETRGIIINPQVLKHLRHITKLDAWQHQLSLSLCFTHITVNTIKNLGSYFYFLVTLDNSGRGGGGLTLLNPFFSVVPAVEISHKLPFLFSLILNQKRGMGKAEWEKKNFSKWSMSNELISSCML